MTDQMKRIIHYTVALIATTGIAALIIIGASGLMVKSIQLSGSMERYEVPVEAQPIQPVQLQYLESKEALEVLNDGLVPTRYL